MQSKVGEYPKNKQDPNFVFKHEKILIAIREMLEQRDGHARGAFSRGELVVAAWRRYPNAFCIDGYVDYPDSHLVMCSLFGKHGLITKKRILPEGSGLYRLPDTIPVDAASFFKLLLSTTAATKLTAGKPVTFNDFVQFLQTGYQGLSVLEATTKLLEEITTSRRKADSLDDEIHREELLCANGVASVLAYLTNKFSSRLRAQPRGGKC